MVLFQSIFCALGGLSLVLIACEAGQHVSDVFSEVDYVLGQMDWYLLSIEMQRMLPAIIMFAQEPVVVKFFGSLSCSREQFKKVSPGLRWSDKPDCCFTFIFCLQISGDECRIQVFYGTS